VSVPADGISAARSPRTAISAVPFQGQLHYTQADAPETRPKMRMSQIGESLKAGRGVGRFTPAT